MQSPDNSLTLRIRDVRRRFDRAAATFDGADFVHATTRDGLFERLEPMTVAAATVIDLGSATGASLQRLKRRFRPARVVAVDLSHRMLLAGRRRSRWFSRSPAVQGDARALPLADHSVDVVFSNLMLPFVDEPETALREVARVLRRDGLFAFSTLGPDSLVEIGAAWQGIDAGVHVMRYPDMHDVGDTLVRAGLRDPVLDVDRLTLHYDSADALYRDLTATGARNSLHRRRSTLTGKGRLADFRKALFGDGDGGRLALEVELVYGHCWGRGVADAAHDVHIDARSIPVRRS